MAAIDLGNEDLTDLCRVCLLRPELADCLDLTLIYDEEENKTYGECFTICTQIDLSESENLPHNLCKSCGCMLQMTYDFYKKVEESKRSLQQYQQQIENDHYTTFEGVTSKHEDPEESPATAKETQQHEPSLVDDSSSAFLVTDQNGVVRNLNVEEEEQFIAIIKDDAEDTTEIIGINSLVDENEDEDDAVHEERLSQADDILVLEEHLDIDEFSNVEALEDEETETLQIKTSSRNPMPLQIFKIQDNAKFIYEEGIPVTAEDDDEEEEYHQQLSLSQRPQQHQNKKNSRSWQENVVAVANKEHLPVEEENYDSRIDNCSEFDFETIQSDTEEDGVESLDTTRTVGRQSRKRHVGSYTCDYCLKEYPNYSRMMSHRRCHDTDRPKYPCSYCNRIYATKQAMECHVQTVHDKTGFACSICTKVFAIRRSLEVHMRFHNGEFPYACNLCDKKFAQLCHLNTHKNVKHLNVRFACDHPNCGKFFTSSTSLRNHEYTHGIMPFECEYCQRGYPAKAKLKVHIKRKHGMDLSKEQLESMRKFHVMRSKVNLVKVVPIKQET